MLDEAQDQISELKDNIEKHCQKEQEKEKKTWKEQRGVRETAGQHET